MLGMPAAASAMIRVMNVPVLDPPHQPAQTISSGADLFYLVNVCLVIVEAAGCGRLWCLRRGL